MTKEKLRFAVLVRVSTEKQGKKGESLRTQKSDLEADIRSMEGAIYKIYAGSEHATPNHERCILDKLLQDAQEKHFDAIIIWSLDRWSRDNRRSADDLQILKDCGIRFFVRTQEFNLHNENDYFMISLYSLMGRTQAYTQTRKSMINRISLAERGVPSAGKLPYGRIYDKETKTWKIDPSKQRIIEDAARRYLSGESMDSIAKLYDMNCPNLHKLLKYRCGETWEIRFRSKTLRIDKTVPLVIPRILDEAVIKQIHDQSEGNKTFTHGLNKHPYLLARMVFCGECGYAIFGQANKDGKLYYRHPRDRGCKKSNFHSIPADPLERAVIDDIFQMLGDKQRIEQAAKDALPNPKEIDDLNRLLAQREKLYKSFQLKKERLLDQIEKAAITNEDVKERMMTLNNQRDILAAEIETIRTKLKTIPDIKSTKMRAQLLLRQRESMLRTRGHMSKMTFDEKRKLLQIAFAGKDIDGKRYGVNVFKNNNGDWLYIIRGIFQDHTGCVRKIDITDSVSMKNEDIDEYKQLKYLASNEKQDIFGQYQEYLVSPSIIPFRLNGTIKQQSNNTPLRY